MIKDDLVKRLISEYGYWGHHKKFDEEVWKYEVENDDTRQGYWEWVVHQLEEVE